MRTLPRAFLVVMSYLLVVTSVFANQSRRSDASPATIIHSALAIGRDQLLIATSSGIAMCDASGTTVRAISNISVDALARTSTGQILAARKSGEVLLADAELRSWRTIRSADVDEWQSSDNEQEVQLLVDADNVMYLMISARGVVRSADDGKSWVELRNNRAHVSDVTTLCFDAFNNVYAGTASSGVLKYDERLHSWQPLSPQAMHMPYIESLTILADNTMLVGASNDVYVSKDEGHHWTRTVLFQTQDDGSINAVEGFEAIDGTGVVAITTQGVFQSRDNCLSWQSGERLNKAHEGAAEAHAGSTYVCVARSLCTRTAHGLQKVTHWSAVQRHG